MEAVLMNVLSGAALNIILCHNYPRQLLLDFFDRAESLVDDIRYLKGENSLLATNVESISRLGELQSKYLEAVNEGNRMAVRQMGSSHWKSRFLIWRRRKDFRRLKELIKAIDKLAEDIKALLAENAHKISLLSQQAAQILLQAERESGLIGGGIKDSTLKLITRLNEAPTVRVIGVYGTAGVGKTAFLQRVYNTYKVGMLFEYVIWVTVPAQFTIPELQDIIAETIHIELGFSNVDVRKKMLSAFLRQKRFLLVLDNLLSPLNLEEMGVEFGYNKESKVVFSTSKRDLIEEMKAEEFEVKPLSKDEAWVLFCKVAFERDHAPQDIENTAKQIADNCEGLPLAIYAMASSMKGKDGANEWDLASGQLIQEEVEEENPHPVDQHLYQVLRCSYDRLPDANFKKCFLYCAMFPQDETIRVEKLVGMLIGEGLVKSNDSTDLIDTAHSCIKLLIDRCLFEVDASSQIVAVRTHNAVREFAIGVGEGEENCLFHAGKMVESFPPVENRNCKRISVCRSNITSLPTAELGCPNLVSLMLNQNKRLSNVPEPFLFNLTSLKVLDLSYTEITSLPKSLWQLIELEYLSLSATQIEEIPEEISHLSKLQFLDLSLCVKLRSLSCQIIELKTVIYLNLYQCVELKSLPFELGELQNVRYLNSNCEFVPVYNSEGYAGSAIL